MSDVNNLDVINSFFHGSHQYGALPFLAALPLATNDRFFLPRSASVRCASLFGSHAPSNQRSILSSTDRISMARF
jgi:hypothetical protein